MRAARVLLSVFALTAGLTIAAGPANAQTDTPTQHATSSDNPIGKVEATKAAAGRVTMTGWAFDRDRLGSAEPVHIYQTSPVKKLIASTGTTIVRADINKVHHITGRHGWSTSFAATSGSDVFCAYAINVGAGTTFEMGCARVTITTTAPTGALETATAHDVTVDLTGWAVDKDAPTTVQPVEIYQTAPSLKLLTTVRTTVARPDVNKAHHLTGTHGWKAAIVSTPGVHTFCAYADNLGPARAHVQIGCRKLTLVAAPGSISGSVADLSGQPLADATVTATAQTGGAETEIKAGADGQYSFAALPPGAYEVCASHEDSTANAPLGYLTDCHAGGLTRVESGQNTSDVYVQLPVASVVTGTVTDSAGSPLSGVRINSGATVSGADGRYSLRTAGSVNVCFDGLTATGGTSKAGYLPRCWNEVDGEPTPVDVPVGQTVSGIDAKLDAAAEITGVVTDGAGHPLSQVGVQLFGNGARQTTGADGTYRFGGLTTDAAADYAVAFTPSDASAGGTSTTGYLAGTSDQIEVTAGSVTVVPEFALNPGAAVSGKLTDAAGHPIVRGTFHLHGDTSFEDSDYTTATDGTFLVKGLAPGPSVLCATSKGYTGRCYSTAAGTDASEFSLVAGVTTRGIIVTQPIQGAISGKVTDSAGKPIEYVKVHAQQQLGNGVFKDAVIVQTSATGTYTVPRLDAGKYDICYYPQNYVGQPFYVQACYKDTPLFTGSSGVVVVAQSRTTSNVNIALQTTGSVTGKVTDSSGKPIYSVEVEAVTADGSETSESSTEQDGSYDMLDVPPGTYKICFDALGAAGPPSDTGWAPQCYPNAEGTAGVKRVTVPAGKALTGINAVLQPRAGISGRVTASDGTPLANVEIDVSGNEAPVVTDEQGYYLLPLTTAGHFAVCFYGRNAHEDPSDPGFANACYDGDSTLGPTYPVTVTPHRTTAALDITLAPLPD